MEKTKTNQQGQKTSDKKVTPRLRKKYEQEVVKKLMEEFVIKNKLAVPKVTKIMVNTGIGEASKDKSVLDQAIKDLQDVTGQTPSPRQAKKSVASFGVRKGVVVGLKVTLRGDRMYSFLDKFISVVTPRLRDFRGLSKDSFDKSGNYSIGIAEQNVFPEIDISKTKPRGLQITIVTSSNDKKLSGKLLEYLGLPFEKDR